MSIAKVRCDVCGFIISGDYFRWTLEDSTGAVNPTCRDMCQDCEKKISSYIRHGLPKISEIKAENSSSDNEKQDEQKTVETSPEQTS